jgi:hypothetical protein
LEGKAKEPLLYKSLYCCPEEAAEIIVVPVEIIVVFVEVIVVASESIV